MSQLAGDVVNVIGEIHGRAHQPVISSAITIGGLQRQPVLERRLRGGIEEGDVGDERLEEGLIEVGGRHLLHPRPLRRGIEPAPPVVDRCRSSADAVHPPAGDPTGHEALAGGVDERPRRRSSTRDTTGVPRSRILAR